MAARVIPVEPFDLVIFGATGDLAHRKILPGLFRRFKAGQMPAGARVIGAARSSITRAEFQDQVRAAVMGFGGVEADDAALPGFLDCLDYIEIDARGDQGWSDLAACVDKSKVNAFYLSVGPSLFSDIIVRLHQFGVTCPESRIVVEKPFGHDLETARALNATLSQHFEESQIYRIDHYLGKETVQNLMAVRFGNILFEPLWNSQFVDHIQITVAETVGVGGRGEYYDKSGALRDMVQNHLVQLLCLIAMEPPNHFDPDAVRDEKLKVIRALDPLDMGDLVRGQYRSRETGTGYLEDVHNPDSLTESFVAMRVGISNWRWKGAPFYLRTGKKLRARSSEIAVIFKDPPHSIFDDQENRRGNALVIRLQPNEGINLRVTIKEPGPGGMRLIEVPLDMSFAEALGDEAGDIPDAYERLVMDVIRGNQTLFMRGDEVEAAWAWIDPLIDAIVAKGSKPHVYETGGSGPDDALMLLHKDGRRWREIRE